MNLPPGITDRMIEEQQESFHYTREDVERLKENWDGTWDIEDTEGFENFYIELKAYRLGVENDFRQSEENKLKNLAIELNCNVAMARQFALLHDRVSKLERFMYHDDRESLE